jgi:hypothetical protein
MWFHSADLPASLRALEKFAKEPVDMSDAQLLSIAPFDRRVPCREKLPGLATLPALPDVEPGQLWLIELPAAADGLPALLRRVLDRVNVVIYDRALADSVAASLPLGSYAEPAASSDETANPAAARAVRFAFDGWSVARLVPARPTQRERIARVRRLVEELAPHRPASQVAVTVRGDLGDAVCEPTETRLSRLDLAVVTYPREACLTIAIHLGDRVGGGAARLHAVAGNGLAG